VRQKRSLSLSYEMTLWIFVLVVIPLIILRVYFYHSITSGLKQVEQEQALAKVSAVEQSLDIMGSSLLGTAADYSNSRDNVQALLHHDMNWLNTYIYSIPNTISNIDFVAEADLQGDIMVQNGNITELTGKVQIPSMMTHAQDTDGYTGLIGTSKGIAIAAVTPVTDSSHPGTPVGMLIVGRFINQGIVQSIYHTLQSNWALLLNTGQFLTSSATIKQSKINKRTSGVLNDRTGQAIALIYIETTSQASVSVAAKFRRQSYIGGGILLFLIILVVYLLRRRIILPLRHFTSTMERIAQGEQIEEVPANVLNAEAEIVAAFQKIIGWNETLEQTVAQRTNAIQLLLDHAGQGFLSIDRSLFVFDEYSIECKRIFKRDIAKLPLPKLLHPDDETEQQLTQSILTQYFLQKDPDSKQVLTTLLPAEVTIYDRTIQLDYKEIAASQLNQNETMMVVMTDITERRHLERKMDSERATLNMVVQVTANYDVFCEMLREYEFFHQVEVGEMIQQQAAWTQIIGDIQKRIHTFKGTSNLLYLIHAVPKLHALEENLAVFMKEQPPNFEMLQQALAEYSLEKWLNEDITLLKNILGADFLKQEQNHSILVDFGRLSEFEHKLNLILKNEQDKSLLQEISRWRFKPMKAFFRVYPAFAERLAWQHGIKLHPLVIEGGERLIDPEYFQAFAKSLVHILRNAIVHGIEDADERVDAGKPPAGQILWQIQEEDTQFHMTISDDGRGIDVEKLRHKAIELGICNAKKAAKLSDLEVMQFIFENNFSTSHKITQFAGRGIGLYVVKDAILQMGGTLEVNSVLGQGTSFAFHIPYSGL